MENLPQKLQLELIQKVSKPNFLDEQQAKLSNHVRDCTICLEYLVKASIKCEKHYGKEKN